MTAPYRAPGLASSTLPASLAAELLAELDPGERVLWTALPEQRALVRRALGQLLMPLAFNGFVLALVALCSRDGGVLALSAVPLLALGLPLFQAPFAAWRATRSTFYALTDRRTLIFEAEAIASVDRRDIVSLRVSAPAWSRAGDIGLLVGPHRRLERELVGVRDARAVAAMISC
jgi:hypothetical protein